MKIDVKSHTRKIKKGITDVIKHKRTIHDKLKTVWIFGYGSLIYPDGINGRGMKYHYNDNDLKEVILRGYKREWNALAFRTRYLGIVKSQFHWVNGVIFQIHSQEDLEALKRSEMAGVVYDFVDVTENVEPKPNNSIILTCVTINPTREGHVAPYYKDIIEYALKVRGKKFEDAFRRTTFE